MPRQLVIQIVKRNSKCNDYCISGLEDFSILELSHIQSILGIAAYNHSVELSYTIDNLQKPKLFKGAKNNAYR